MLLIARKNGRDVHAFSALRYWPPYILSRFANPRLMLVVFIPRCRAISTLTLLDLPPPAAIHHLSRFHFLLLALLSYDFFYSLSPFPKSRLPYSPGGPGIYEGFSNRFLKDTNIGSLDRKRGQPGCKIAAPEDPFIQDRSRYSPAQRKNLYPNQQAPDKISRIIVG